MTHKQMTVTNPTPETVDYISRSLRFKVPAHGVTNPPVIVPTALVDNLKAMFAKSYPLMTVVIAGEEEAEVEPEQAPEQTPEPTPTPEPKPARKGKAAPTKATTETPEQDASVATDAEQDNATKGSDE